MRNSYIIGIDPDCDMSGVSVLNTDTKEMTPMKLSFVGVLRYLQSCAKDGKQFKVIVEGGWLNRSNWHARGASAALAAEIGRRTGMNHQTGILIAQMCEACGYPHAVVKPLRKVWKNKDGKISQVELQKVVGKKLPRMNQDQRDACLLAWVYAGLPIKVQR